MKSQGSSKASS